MLAQPVPPVAETVPYPGAPAQLVFPDARPAVAGFPHHPRKPGHDRGARLTGLSRQLPALSTIHWIMPTDPWPLCMTTRSLVVVTEP
jgi:hypothetical protein